MSGPKSTNYRLSDAIDDLNRAAQELRLEVQRREEEERRHAEQERKRREAEARARAEEARRREEARQQQLSAARSTRRRLVMLRERIVAAIASLPPESGIPPAIPEVPEIKEESMEGLTSLLRNFESINHRLDEIKARVEMSGMLADLDVSTLGKAETVGEMLDRYAASRNRHSVTSSQDDTLEKRRDIVNRIIGRLLEVSIEELPPALESLMQRALGVENTNRFEMLCTELRLQVQQNNERVERRKKAMELAHTWLSRIESLDVDGTFAELRESLVDIRSGGRSWDDDIENKCQTALAELEHAVQRRRDARASKILEATLRDLGYKVDSIGKTLFTEGGAVYFQAGGWNDYYMRLRIMPDRGVMHFNMVRSAEGMASTQRDLEMEREWCSKYPRLMEVLGARGIGTTSLRALPAGTYEVETVQPTDLPEKRWQSESRGATAPSQMQRKPTGE